MPKQRRSESITPKPPTVAKATLSMAQSLGQSEPLARLTRRVHESQARLVAVMPCLPPLWAAQVRPGPLDDAGWTLLVANPAIAAKLRQLLPRLAQALADQGWPARAIKVKTLTGQ